MSGQFYEVLKDGKPTSQLFFTEENARLWVKTHGDGNHVYTVRQYKQKQA